jgi:hypothetical protein
MYFPLRGILTLDAASTIINRLSKQCITLTLTNNSPSNKDLASPCIIFELNSSHLNIPSQILGMVVLFILPPPSQSLNNSISRPPSSISANRHPTHRLDLPPLSH